MTVITPPTGGAGALVNGYAALLDINSDDLLLKRFDNQAISYAGGTTLASVTGPPPAFFWRDALRDLKLECIGSTIKATFVMDSPLPTQVLTATDTTYTNGRPGAFGGVGSGAGGLLSGYVLWDNWEAEGVAFPGTTLGVTRKIRFNLHSTYIKPVKRYRDPY